jgi:hypothetical protein
LRNTYCVKPLMVAYILPEGVEESVAGMKQASMANPSGCRLSPDSALRP